MPWSNTLQLNIQKKRYWVWGAEIFTSELLKTSHCFIWLGVFTAGWLLKKNSLLSVPWVLIRNRWWIRCLKIVLKCRKKGHSVVLQETCPFNKCNTVDMIGKKKRSRNDVHSICNRQWFSDYYLKFLLVDWIDDSCAYFLLQWCGIFDGGLWRSKQFTV